MNKYLKYTLMAILLLIVPLQAVRIRVPTFSDTTNTVIHPGDRRYEIIYNTRDSALYFSENGNRWKVLSTGTSAFSSLSDVTISGLNGGEILIQRGGKLINDSLAGDGTLDSLCNLTVTDVTVGSDATGDLLYKSSATALARLAKGTAGQFLQMNTGATAPQWSSFSGDIAVGVGGAVTVTDFTITSEAQGDVLYFNGSNWVRLGAGTSGQYLKTQGAAANPMWDTPVLGTASTINDPFTIECGTYDYTVNPDAPAAGRTIILLDPGATDTLVLARTTQTLTNKTLTAPRIANAGFIADANGNELIIFTTTSSAVNELTYANAASAGRPTFTASGETDVSIGFVPKGTGDVFFGTGAAAAEILSSGNFDLTLKTGNATTGSINIEDGADADITFAVNGGGRVDIQADTTLIGVGDATANLSSSGARDLVLMTNKSTNSGLITITQGANADITVTPNGTGNVNLSADAVRVGDNNANATITTDGTGDLILNTNAGTNSGVITIEDAADGDIIFAVNGGGNVLSKADTTILGVGDAQANLSTSGAYDLKIMTNMGTNAGTIVLAQGANTHITVTPNGTGNVVLAADEVTVGDAGATALVASSGAGNLVLATNSNTTSGNITITQGASADITITPNGTGNVVLSADQVTVGDQDATAIITSNGAGNLTLETNTGTNSGIITITQGANANITITPNGTGNVALQADEITCGDANANVTVTSSGTGNLILNTNSGTNSGAITVTQGVNADITLIPNGTGLTAITAAAFTVTDKADNAPTLTEAEGGVILCGNTAARTYTLPTVTGNSGLWYFFKKYTADAFAVTIDGSGDETIDGTANYTAIDADNDAAMVVCDGDEWHILSVWVH